MLRSTMRRVVLLSPVLDSGPRGAPQRLAAIGAISLTLVVGGCVANVTESDEYRSLQQDFDAAQQQVEEVSSQLEETSSQLEESQLSVADSETSAEEMARRVDALEETVASAEARADQAEEDLELALNPEWPDVVKEEFLIGCTSEPTEGLTTDQTGQLCSCLIDELEEQVSLTDFMILSLSTLDPDAALNPLTGLPVDLDETFVEVFTTAGIACALQVGT